MIAWLPQIAASQGCFRPGFTGREVANNEPHRYAAPLTERCATWRTTQSMDRTARAGNRSAKPPSTLTLTVAGSQTARAQKQRLRPSSARSDRSMMSMSLRSQMSPHSDKGGTPVFKDGRFIQIAPPKSRPRQSAPPTGRKLKQSANAANLHQTSSSRKSSSSSSSSRKSSSSSSSSRSSRYDETVHSGSREQLIHFPLSRTPKPSVRE